MNSLREIQQRCYRAFLFGQTSHLTPDLVDNGIPATTRVKVYQNNAREIFRKTLMAAYPVVERLVGEVCFRSLALRYMREHPSASGDLQGFGRAFPSFLSTLYAGTRYAYLPDVASLEWACEEAHLAPDDAPLDPRRLGRIDNDDLPTVRFEIARGSHLVTSPYPILAIWRTNQPGNEATVELSSGPQHVVVLRRAGDVEMYPISAHAFELASRLESGLPLGEACDGLDERTDFDLAACLQSLLGIGLLTGFSVAASRAD